MCLSIKEILAPFCIKRERLTRFSCNSGIYSTDSKTALAEFGNLIVTAPIPYAGKVVTFPYAILHGVGARLLKRSILQQIYNVAPESRI